MGPPPFRSTFSERAKCAVEYVGAGPAPRIPRDVVAALFGVTPNVLGVSIEEFSGRERAARAVRSSTRRLSPRAQRHAERLQALSKMQQRFVIRIIDNLEDITVIGISDRSI